jgi:5-formyltetrahydrofolate cyclo-ligase
MFGLGLDEITVLGVLALLLFNEKQAAQGIKWLRTTKSKWLNLRSDLEAKLTDTVHDVIKVEAAVEATEPINLRKQVRFRLANLEDFSRAEKSRRICAALEDSELVAQSQVIALFHPMSQEPQILSFAQNCLDSGKKILLPWIDRESQKIGLSLIQDLQTDLVQGAYGILEPKPEIRTESSPKPDLILVPGLVFGLQGERLGHGQGWYDRLLSTLPHTPTCGVAFEMQVFNTYIPQENHDVPMNWLCTEQGLRQIKSTTTEESP